MTIEIDGKSYETDEEGYLVNLSEWSKALAEDKGNSLYLFKLFPGGPAKQACKYAGMPKPTGCI